MRKTAFLLHKLLYYYERNTPDVNLRRDIFPAPIFRYNPRLRQLRKTRIYNSRRTVLTGEHRAVPAVAIDVTRLVVVAGGVPW